MTGHRRWIVVGLAYSGAAVVLLAVIFAITVAFTVVIVSTLQAMGIL